MMKNLSNFFLWNNPKPFANSFEENLRKEKANLFPYSFSMYNSNSSIFDLVKSAIVLLSISNKRHFDYLLNNFSSSQLEYNESLLYKDLKYLIYDDEKIYLPFFSKEINRLFANDLSKLKESKYSDIISNEKKYYINPFSYYKYHIFDSLFTRLILINNIDNIFFFYHIELETLLIIDSYGNLENEFSLFDEKCKKVKENIFSRLINISNCYMISSESFLNSLYENKVISNQLYEMAKKYLLKKNENI